MTNLSKEEQHAAIYATSHLPAFEFGEVWERVWAGRNPLTDVDVETLLSNGITHILDLREEREWLAPRFGMDAMQELAVRRVCRKHIPIADQGAPTSEDLENACAFIREALAEAESRLYIHCRAGQERTGAVLVAFYAREQYCGFERAVQFVTSARPNVALLPNQREAVRRWLRNRKR